MSNDEIEEKKISNNLKSIKLKKAINFKSRDLSNLNQQKDSSLILKDYSTPNPSKNEKTLPEIEMRKTIHIKHNSIKNNKIFNNSNSESSNKITNKR